MESGDTAGAGFIVPFGLAACTGRACCMVKAKQRHQRRCNTAVSTPSLGTEDRHQRVAGTRCCCCCSRLQLRHASCREQPKACCSLHGCACHGTCCTLHQLHTRLPRACEHLTQRQKLASLRAVGSGSASPRRPPCVCTWGVAGSALAVPGCGSQRPARCSNPRACCLAAAIAAACSGPSSR